MSGYARVDDVRPTSLNFNFQVIYANVKNQFFYLGVYHPCIPITIIRNSGMHANIVDCEVFDDN